MKKAIVVSTFIMALALSAGHAEAAVHSVHCFSNKLPDRQVQIFLNLDAGGGKTNLVIQELADNKIIQLSTLVEKVVGKTDTRLAGITEYFAGRGTDYDLFISFMDTATVTLDGWQVINGGGTLQIKGKVIDLTCSGT